jgi:hypothetical protein
MQPLDSIEDPVPGLGAGHVGPRLAAGRRALNASSISIVILAGVALSCERDIRPGCDPKVLWQRGRS